MNEVYVTHVIINGQLEFAGVFANKEDAYGYLSSNGLAGTVNHTEVVGVSKDVNQLELINKRLIELAAYRRHEGHYKKK